jgi:type IV pilus assembly protein PilC
MSFKLEQNITVPAKEQKVEKNTNFFTRDIQLFNKFGDKKKERFYMDLRVLLVAGIDLKSALEIIIEEQPKEKDKEIFEEIYQGVVKGRSLADSLKQTQKFSEYEYYSIEIGEESNRLNEVLQELTKYYADQTELKKQVKSVLSYPAFVFSITLGLVYFMMTNVVPMFADVFRQFGSELPTLTKKIIHISNNFPFYLMIMAAVIICIGLFIYTQKEKDWYRNATSSLVLRIPKVGQMVQLVYLSRFTQTLHLLLASKTPLVRSLELTEKMVKFYPLQQAIDRMKTDITMGKSLHSGMSDFKVFPKRMISLVKVGEEVNQLEVMLKKLSEQYNEELKHQTKIIGKIMEPLIILIIGLFVGLILVAMYMPMFNLSNIMAQ